MVTCQNYLSACSRGAGRRMLNSRLNVVRQAWIETSLYLTGKATLPFHYDRANASAFYSSKQSCNYYEQSNFSTLVDLEQAQVRDITK